MKTAKKLLAVCLALLMIFSFVACSQPDEKLVISADKTTVKPGDVVTLSSDKTDATVVYEITAGEEYATLSADKLTVKDSATDGAKIKVSATAGDLTSNVLTITVSNPLEAITASAGGVTNVLAGGSVILQKTLNPQNSGANVSWTIVEGADSCAIAGDVLVVNATAKTGTTIKVKATSGSVESNVLSFTVGYPLTAITASVVGSANIEAGNSAPLLTTITPANATDAALEWQFIEGGDFATIANNIITVKPTTPVGSTITFKAVSGSVESNVVTVTVGVPITSITIEAVGSTTIVKGNSVIMSETVAPENASAAGITWQIVEGAEHATITGKTLVVKPTATTGATIKVKASSGSIESNVLTFTVGATQEEINATRYLMSFDESKLTLDKNGFASPVLELNVYNYNFEPVENLTINYEIVSGADFLTITPNGYSCALLAKGHGTATVKATIDGTAVSQTATVNVIVPPESISLPEVFRERPGFAYNFSKLDPATNAVELLPFSASAVGTLVCTDLKYSFAHADGTQGDDVAVYEDGKITFKKTGEVTVTVSSNSGSRNEASVSYRFNINEGYNVSTFEELYALANNAAYTGTLPINLVVFEKPDGTANSYEYGFDLVPLAALKPSADQTISDIATLANRISFTNKGLILNGNKHKIDASQLRIPTGEEIAALNAQGNTWSSHSSLFGVYPWSDTGAKEHNTYSVKIADFEVVGNCPITLDANTANPQGVYKIGILIGSYDSDFTADYYLDMDNVNATAMNVGMRFIHVVEGDVKNTFVNNCFSNGLEVAGSIITLEDMIYGACGATGIELVPQHCDKAGIGRNQNQQVTYKGEVNVQFYNNGQTEYLANYKAAGVYDIPTILAASFEASGLQPNQLLHLNDGQGFVFVTFKFHDLGVSENTSQLIYPGFQSGGIINAKDLPNDGTFDTTHEYIELDVGIPNIDAGKAYFYNVKYQPK